MGEFGYVFYSLFMACCMFILAMSGFLVALAMWRKSSKLCNECKEELNK